MELILTSLEQNVIKLNHSINSLERAITTLKKISAPAISPAISPAINQTATLTLVLKSVVDFGIDVIKDCLASIMVDIIKSKLDIGKIFQGLGGNIGKVFQSLGGNTGKIFKDLSKNTGKIFQGLSVYIGNIVKGLGGNIGKVFKGLSKNTGKIFQGLGGNIGKVFQSITTISSKLLMFAKTNPFIMIILGIIALVGALYFLNSKSDVLQGFFTNIKNIATDLGNIFNKIWEAVQTVIDPIVQLINKNLWFVAVIDTVKAALESLLIGFGSYVVYMKSATVLSSLWSAILGFKTGLISVATKSFWAMNAAIIANPIGAIIAVAVGVLAYLMMNIDWILNAWDNMIASVKNLGGVFGWLGNVFDLIMGNFLRGIQWVVDKFKELFGMTGQAIPELVDGKKKAPSTEPSKGMQALNNEVIIPIAHTNFLAKNNIGGEVISSAGTVHRANPIHSRAQSSKLTEKSSTVVHIDKVEIADGVISNLGDFVLQLHQRVGV